MAQIYFLPPARKHRGHQLAGGTIDIIGTLQRYIEKTDRVLDAVPELQKNTDTIQAWMPWAVVALGAMAAGLLLVATKK